MLMDRTSGAVRRFTIAVRPVLFAASVLLVWIMATGFHARWTLANLDQERTGSFGSAPEALGNRALELSPPQYGAQGDVTFRHVAPANAANVSPGASISWDWGDGSDVTEQSLPASHRYLENGLYRVTVSTLSGRGETLSEEVSVTINTVPSPFPGTRSTGVWAVVAASVITALGFVVAALINRKRPDRPPARRRRTARHPPSLDARRSALERDHRETR